MHRESRRPLLVESPANPTVRLLRELHGRKGRKEHGAFLIEGTRLVAEAVAASWPLLVALYDHERAGSDPQLRALVEQIPGAVPASSRAIEHACDTVTPQGIVAAARLPSGAEAPPPDEPLLLVMDGLADPGNAGTLLRSALAAGVRTVMAVAGGGDLFAPKVVRSGMGAHFHLRLATELTWPEITRLMSPDRAVVLAESGVGMVYHSFDWRRSAALVIGGEARGPSPEAARIATHRVTIPLEAGVESLNAAVAGSVILFEAKRQRDLSRD